MLKRIAAAGALAGCLAANASAQVIGPPADSLPVHALLEAIAREAAQGKNSIGASTVESISQSRIPSWRADSLLAGLRDIARTGGTPDVRAQAAAMIAASGTQHRQAALLLEVFDSAQDARTRAVIVNALPTFPDRALRRSIILKCVQLSGDRGSNFLVGMGIMTALAMGDEGVGILQQAIKDGIVKDENTRTIIEAGIQKHMSRRDR